MSAELETQLTTIIARALPEATQGTKWNAPSFAIDGRDIVTLNHPPKGGQIRVIFHRGAKAKDTTTGLTLLPDPDKRLTWPSDQRAIACFREGAPVDADFLARTCRDWVNALSTSR